jgi:multimeric flavodoxin WrbA
MSPLAQSLDEIRVSRSNMVMKMTDENVNSVAIILGSARSDGNTAALVHHLGAKLFKKTNVFDLSRLIIEPFEYDLYTNRDDFRSVVDMILQSQHIVFATPVYWYSMSARLKVFFDRLTDLLHDPNDRITGRAFAGRNVWLISTGTEESLPPGFDVPFAQTACYFAMVWRQAFYGRSINGEPLSPESLAEAEKLASLINADNA